MKRAHSEINMNGFQGILERKQAELIQDLRNPQNIAIERSADQIDEIQYARERDLAIRNVDRESALLREVRAALQRIRHDSFGTCVECDCAIGPRRLAAVPWASRCIRCQDAAEQVRNWRTDSVGELLGSAA